MAYCDNLSAAKCGSGFQPRWAAFATAALTAAAESRLEKRFHGLKNLTSPGGGSTALLRPFIFFE